MEIIVSSDTMSMHGSAVERMIDIAFSYCDDVAVTTISNSRTFIVFADAAMDDKFDDTATIHLEVPQKLINILVKNKYNPEGLHTDCCENINEARALCAIIKAQKRLAPLNIKALEVAFSPAPQ